MELAAFKVSWQVFWFAAILALSRLTGLAATAATARPRCSLLYFQNPGCAGYLL